jgi:hypothetical protein
MADDNKTMMYLVGGGLLIALVVLSTKKASASTGGGGGGGSGDKLPDLTKFPGTNVVPRTVPGTTTTPSTPYVPATPVNFVPPTVTNPVLRVKILTASGNLTLRRSPSKTAGSVGSLARNSLVDVYSYATGESVNGNTNWFNNGVGYFSAYYTDHPSVGANLGGIDTAPPATGGPSGNARVTTSSGTLRVRSAANTSSAIVGNLTNGATITVGNTVTGESVNGNNKWYPVISPYVGYSHSANIALISPPNYGGIDV